LALGAEIVAFLGVIVRQRLDFIVAMLPATACKADCERPERETNISLSSLPCSRHIRIDGKEKIQELLRLILDCCDVIVNQICSERSNR